MWLDHCTVPVPLVPRRRNAVGPSHQIPPTFREDVIAQNQLTLVTVVMPGQIDRVRAVMAAIDSYSKRLSPPGSLIGISTIHFVKWFVIDDGRRLLMVSDYDGSWESYIDEFAEMILSGLDAIWETSYGYPPDGARDLPAFKRFLRSHQVPAEIFFSAYPEETVLNIVNDRALAHACAGAAGAPLQACSAGVMSAGCEATADDVLADIQGFITSGYGHLSQPRTLRPVSGSRIG